MIVSDPEEATLRSDNLDALIGLYRSLQSDDQRKTFEQALLDRLSPDRGYLAVSYFIVAVFWKIGMFAEALTKAKRDLPRNEWRVYGLSNVLMLLNGLLRYRYPDFSDHMLDQTEQLTHGLSETVFLIPAKMLPSGQEG